MNDPTKKKSHFSDKIVKGQEFADDSLFKDPILMEHKFDYIKRPKNMAKQNEDDCIICNIVNNDPETPSYEIFRNDKFILFLNLFPYTSGHLLISPLKHIIDFEELDDEEIKEFGILIKKSILMLKHAGKTDSLNIGWNQGVVSGGSIRHYHTHIVPRYPNELNFIEIIAKSRPVIISLENTVTLLKKYVPFLKGDKTIKEIFKE